MKLEYKKLIDIKKYFIFIQKIEILNLKRYLLLLEIYGLENFKIVQHHQLQID